MAHVPVRDLELNIAMMAHQNLYASEISIRCISFVCGLREIVRMLSVFCCRVISRTKLSRRSWHGRQSYETIAIKEIDVDRDGKPLEKREAYGFHDDPTRSAVPSAHGAGFIAYRTAI
jgi:hypothetical protein